MSVWALADLHLSLSVPEKTMEVFGPCWKGYMDQIESNWKERVAEKDLILLPGDISWANTIEEAQSDLIWIHQLPGTKVLLKGNHDHWWPSNKRLREKLPPSIHFIHNTVFNWNDISIGGSRLWDSSEYTFEQIIQMVETPPLSKKQGQDHCLEEERRRHIFERELIRLELSLSQLSQTTRMRIAMTHYPPIGFELKESRASKILERHGVDICVFGHLHNLKTALPIFGKKNRVLYSLVSADYLKFIPLKLV